MKTVTALLSAIAIGSAITLGVPTANAQNVLMENALAEIIKKARHDIVVIDTDKKIVADTIVANVGTKFTDDSGNEVGLTLKDGKPRLFLEKSKDYPQGLQQEVLAVKDKAGKIIGAVVVSRDVLKP